MNCCKQFHVLEQCNNFQYKFTVFVAQSQKIGNINYLEQKKRENKTKNADYINVYLIKYNGSYYKNMKYGGLYK